MHFRPYVEQKRRDITGTKEHLMNALQTIDRRGELVQVHKAVAVPTPADPDRWKVSVTLRTMRRPPWLRYGLVAAGILAVAALIAWAVVVILSWVAAHVVAIAGVVAALVLLSFLGHAPLQAAGCCPCHRR